MKVHEFTKLENKLSLETRNSGDRLAWFEYLPENLIRQ
jgi:hypothetical protein